MNTTKKTIVEKTIVRRTPSGRILSKTITRTVYYDDIDNKQRANGAHLEVERTHCARSESTKHVSNPRSYTSLEIIEDVPPNMPRQFRSQQDYMKNRTSGDDDDRSLRSEYPESTRLADEFLYGDDWSNSGTLSRQSRAVNTGSTCESCDKQHDSNFILQRIVAEINRRRKENGVVELNDDAKLRKRAREWAGYLVLSDQFRCREGSSMNVWMGTTPALCVVDEWERDMRSWSGDIFHSDKISRIGIGRAYDDCRHAFIIVAEYE
uniref:SCP domain-containing protein n=1 Tax=Parascaris univalens TaxID=6257 RepID=A0A915A7L6_PARUN